MGRVLQWRLHNSLNVTIDILTASRIALIVRHVDAVTHAADQVLAVACLLGVHAVLRDKRYKLNAYPIDEAVCLGLAQLSISSLEFCHYRAVCYPDIKLENMLLTKDGRLKITDFSMSAMHASGILQNTVYGSPSTAHRRSSVANFPTVPLPTYDIWVSFSLLLPQA